jgi:hypothetical protein
MKKHCNKLHALLVYSLWKIQDFWKSRVGSTFDSQVFYSFRVPKQEFNNIILKIFVEEVGPGPKFTTSIYGYVNFVSRILYV